MRYKGGTGGALCHTMYDNTIHIAVQYMIFRIERVVFLYALYTDLGLVHSTRYRPHMWFSRSLDLFMQLQIAGNLWWLLFQPYQPCHQPTERP